MRILLQPTLCLSNLQFPIFLHHSYHFGKFNGLMILDRRTCVALNDPLTSLPDLSAGMRGKARKVIIIPSNSTGAPHNHCILPAFELWIVVAVMTLCKL
jgi:hypothetical protein